MMKGELIALVKRAWREKDPKKKALLWEEIREAGVPPDGTVYVPEEKKEEGDAGAGL